MQPSPWEVERGDSQIHPGWHYFTVSSRKKKVLEWPLPPWQLVNHARQSHFLNPHHGWVMSNRCLQAHLSATQSIPVGNPCASTLQVLEMKLFAKVQNVWREDFLVDIQCCHSISRVRQWANKSKPSGDTLSQHLQTFILLPQFSWEPFLLRYRQGCNVDSCFCGFKT